MVHEKAYTVSMSNKTRLFAVGAAIGVIIVVVILFRPKATQAPTTNTLNNNANQAVEATNTNSATNSSVSNVNTEFSTDDLPDRDPKFSFTSAIPKTWVVEYVAGSKAINIYDPYAAGTTNLDQSRIFITFFQASDFQTLTTVTVKSRTPTTINGHAAVTYSISKKTDVPNFNSQPIWRNQEHRVTDIRTSTKSPTVFYALAKAPAVSNQVFDDFLKSLKFTSDDSVSSVIRAGAGFLARGTKASD